MERGRSGRRVGINWRNFLNMLLSSSSADVALTMTWEVALTQSDIKVNITLYCLCCELIYIQLLVLNLKVLGFFYETAHQHPREGTWVITICVVHLYIRKKYEVSVYLMFRGRCWYIFWTLLGVFFFIGLFGVFFHTATGTSCGSLEMLYTV